MQYIPCLACNTSVVSELGPWREYKHRRQMTFDSCILYQRISLCLLWSIHLHY